MALPTPISINGIPSDYSATENPYIPNTNAIIPNYQFEEEEIEEDFLVYRLDMTGIMNPYTHEWLDLYGTGLAEQNVWLSLDGNPKGLLVKNHSEDGTISRKFDLVFLVDNSGSMNEESDALTRDIISWANNLTNSGIDIQFGCVGYSEYGYVNGGIDFSNQTGLNTFLNYGSGTSRTQHFGGINAETLEYYAERYGDVDGECGMMALRFANDYFSFRNGANRIYVNFTDEPNQPDHVSGWSVEYLNPANGNWTPQQGTVHTVFSGSPNFTNQTGYAEKPWLMSEYTGGTVLYASSNFSGVSLNTLPVTGAMQHSYSIYFVVPETMKDGQYHSLKVTVLSQDQSVRAERNFSIRFE
ncbi:MAG: VWA domain-containing protein [Bacteroidales bacterium]|nr:VWA domain-containing protein [Bacteroidales bacterium]